MVGKNNTCFDSRDNCNAIINTSTNELILGCNNTVIPNDVTSIGSYAFYKCNGLSTIYIPESVISIKDDSFIECIGLTSISVDKANAKYDSRDNCNAIIETESNRLIVACSNSIIPKGVSSFNNNALRNCISLALPDGIEKITQSMFDGCVKLVTLKIPGSVKVIEENAFNSCSSLKNVIFENGKDSLKFSLFYVNYYAKPVWFSSCPLDSIYIGRNIKYDFTPKGYGTYSLSPFREKETLRKVVFGDNVTIIPSAMFDGCVNLTSVETPEKMDSIGHSAFKGCEKLSSFKMPQGIRTIDNNAFYKCKSLTSVDIPGTVEKIGESAFYYCED